MSHLANGAIYICPDGVFLYCGDGKTTKLSEEVEPSLRVIGEPSTGEKAEDICDRLVRHEFCKSRSEAQRKIKEGAVYVALNTAGANDKATCDWTRLASAKQEVPALVWCKLGRQRGWL